MNKQVAEWIKRKGPQRIGKLEESSFGHRHPALEGAFLRVDVVTRRELWHGSEITLEEERFVYRNDHLHCECSACGHEYQAECEFTDPPCDCCGGMCT